jgi:steroid 5-alpha reductase family enzyme
MLNFNILFQSYLEPNIILIFFMFYTITLFTTSIGFYRFLYFITIGYAFTILSLSLISIVLSIGNISITLLIQLSLLGTYGLRLLIFLVQRETQKPYRMELEAIHKNSRKIPFFAKLATWGSVSILYLFMFSPALFILQTKSPSSFFQTLGLVFMVLGFALEITADHQKGVYKKKNPHHYCDIGLYQWVRFPNYLGEIVFWLGNWIVGWTAYSRISEWMISTLGLIGIIIVMIVSSVRLEKKQYERYGSDLQFQEYSSSIPILIPWLPVYSLKNFIDSLSKW